MEASQIFYLCPKCFEVFESEPIDHQHKVIRIDAASLNAASRQPMTDSAGHLTSRAPRWFLEATGMLPHDPNHGAVAV